MSCSTCSGNCCSRIFAVRYFGKNDGGSTLMEAALTLPFLLVLVFGIIQYGYIFAAYVTLRSATAVTARYVTLIRPDLSATDSSITAYARDALGPMFDPARLSAPTVSDVTVGGVGGARKVELQYSMPLLLPFVVPGASGGNLTMTAVSVMR